MTNANSQKFFQQAQSVMVGGVNSPVRAFNSVGGNPLIIESGSGTKIFDVDGNGYTDYCCGWGSLILGHAHRNVVLAGRKRINKGISYGTTTREEIDIAKYIVEHVPSIDLLRFVNSGTEATMSAIRLARGFTKKSMLVKFDGCYHGHFDDLLIKAGSGVAKLKESSSLGITRNHIEGTLSLPYNDLQVAEETLARYKDEIACVIVEPVAGNMGVIPAQKEFLQGLRALTKKFNIVFILDEIITGFRMRPGGVQVEYGITPDLTCLGKIIGGGFPVGAYGGRREIMECLAPLGGVYQAGTFSGNPVVMRSGLATLKMLTPAFYEILNRKAEHFSQSLNQYFKDNNISAHLSVYKSMLSLRFQKDPVQNYAEAQGASNQELYAQLFQYLLSQGIYFPPADLESFFISGVHTQKALDVLLKKIKEFFNTKKGRSHD
ncbi:MAG: glutamate-1-semialdehyde-2,1-aminomutase [Omnitrophica WOR_2 bacterium RIFCSPHIGHO2_02_FULL_48_11]|nr:MAG: glutamate-1-semialdehyde-2,1-aminomutase [Omnitrophica WOR_2 bacterium RIFCSPHIGHO2_02_FULL_48_11]